jgi:type III secretion system chaperone SycN
MLEQVMTEFGRRLGLGHLALLGGRPLTLDIKGLGNLSLELEAQGKAEVLMTLAAPLPPYDQTAMKRALEICSFDQSRLFNLSAGCQADHLLLMTRLPIDGCQGSDLERAAEMLIVEMRSILTEGVG